MSIGLTTRPNKSYRLVLKANSPIALLSTRASAQFAKSLDYLPGSTIRGAVAEIFLNKRGSEDPLFQRIFMQEAIRFHDFLPAVQSEPSVYLPLSASACKRHKLDHASSLKDRLIQKMTKRQEDNGDVFNCPECQKELDRVRGYIYRENGEWKARKLQRQLRMHVGISRERGSALHGFLFSYDMLTQKSFGERESGDREENALRFAGDLEIVAEKADELWAELMKIIGNEHLSVGKARTRGLGEMEIEDNFALEQKDDFDERWERFNTAIKKQNTFEEYSYFSITLKSHLILRDDLGRPVLERFGTEDCPIFNSFEGLKRVVAFTNTTVVSGWNAAQGLPKPDMPALARGSVFGFLAEKSQEDDLKQALKALENTGIGERRSEGFGQISVCDRLHVDLA